MRAAAVGGAWNCGQWEMECRSLGPAVRILATILAEEGRAKEAEELFREGLSMYAILAQAHPEREDFRLGEEAFREFYVRPLWI